MAKRIFHGSDARERLLAGAKIHTDAIRLSFGPKGPNVAIARQFGGPTITHDGETISNAIDLPDVDDHTLGNRAGAKGIQEATAKLTKAVGNGRTAAAILTYSIQEGVHHLLSRGHNPQDVSRGIDIAGAEVINALDSLNERIKDDSARVAEVATVAANGNEEIGTLIADIIKKIGKEGVVTVEASQGLDLEADIVEGFTLNRGWVSPYFITDQTRQEAVYENPAVIITDKQLHNAEELLPLIEQLLKANKKDLVLVADVVQDAALAVFILNKLKGTFNTVAIKAPAFGDWRKEVLEDMAVLTGATVISEESGLTFANASLEVVGTAKKVIVGKDSTTIIEGAGKESDIAGRIKEIKSQIKPELGEFDKQRYESRAGALAGKVAVIKVGGVTETEIEEKKFRVDDAVASTKAALAEGIVPGGAITLVNLSRMIESAEPVRKTWYIGLLELFVGASYTADETVESGRQVLKEALVQPFLQLTSNAGLNSRELLQAVQNAPDGYGIDVNAPNKGLIDVKKAGVIDPTPVVREVIRTAVSLASTHATVDALVVDIPEKTELDEAEGMGY